MLLNPIGGDIYWRIWLMSKREWKLFVEDMEFEDLKEDRKQ